MSSPPQRSSPQLLPPNQAPDVSRETSNLLNGCQGQGQLTSADDSGGHPQGPIGSSGSSAGFLYQAGPRGSAVQGSPALPTRASATSERAAVYGLRQRHAKPGRATPFENGATGCVLQCLGGTAFRNPQVPPVWLLMSMYRSSSCRRHPNPDSMASIAHHSRCPQATPWPVRFQRPVRQAVCGSHNPDVHLSSPCRSNTDDVSLHNHPGLVTFYCGRWPCFDLALIFPPLGALRHTIPPTDIPKVRVV